MQKGKQQLFELGTYLRHRYYDLLPDKGSYHPNNIYIQSTDVDRCLTSAAHCLAGMFPPIPHKNWNKSLMWQAIPIHTTPRNLDHILAMERLCPLYKQAYDDYMQSSEVQSAIKRNSPRIQNIEQRMGMKFHSLVEMQETVQGLIVEQARNLP